MSSLYIDFCYVGSHYYVSWCNRLFEHVKAAKNKNLCIQCIAVGQGVLDTLLKSIAKQWFQTCGSGSFKSKQFLAVHIEHTLISKQSSAPIKGNLLTVEIPVQQRIEFNFGMVTATL